MERIEEHPVGSEYFTFGDEPGSSAEEMVGPGAAALAADGPGTADAERLDALAYAGFGVRFAARALDLIIIYALAFATNFAGGMLLAIVVALAGGSRESLVQRLSAPTGWSFLIALLAAMAYHAVAEGVHGSTPGKMMLDLTVLSETGESCGLGAAFGRELAYVVDTLFFGAIAYGSMRGSRRRQRLGDKWAHTVVVRRDSSEAARRRTPWRFVAASVSACLTYGAFSFGALLMRL